MGERGVYPLGYLKVGGDLLSKCEENKESKSRGAASVVKHKSSTE